MKPYDYIIDKVSRCIVLAPLMCLLILCSCATPKNTESDSSADYADLIELIRTSITGLEKKIDTQSQTTSEKLSNMKIENKTVYLSVPDSTGKQHTTMESTTTATKVDEQRDETVQQTTELLSIINQRIDSLSRKIDLASETKVVEKKLTKWETLCINVGGWAIGIVIITILIVGGRIIYKWKK
jgi:hypothetical protein